MWSGKLVNPLVDGVDEFEAYKGSSELSVGDRVLVGGCG